jgi:NTP pyrophosphatase (non-canonical NTP hydrolase)
MKRIYIAHPLIGDRSPEWGDREKNLDRYLRICAWATEQGHVVLSWVHHVLTHDAGLTCTHEQDAHDYYLSRDEALVAVADEVWVCCPAGVSRGVDREIAFAEKHGIPVLQVHVYPAGGLYQLPVGDIRIPGDDWPGTGSTPWPLSIRSLVAQAHATAREKGWWGPNGDEDRNIPEQLALMHSELSEALEEIRAGRAPAEITTDADGKPGKPGGFPVELADLLIRVADTCGRYGIDLETALRRKLAYNRGRPYRHGGKTC